MGGSQLIFPGRGNGLDIAAALFPPPYLNLIDLELLMHWKDTTYQILCPHPHATPRYVDLLREHDPLALIILVYYCTILHKLRHSWCLEGWGTRIAGALWCVLGGQCQWRDLMRWAMEDIFGFDICTGSTWSPSSPGCG